MSALTLAAALALLGFPGEPASDATPKTLYKPEMFQTLVNPDCSYCVDENRRVAGSLRDDDRVLAWIRGDHDGGAIPYRWFLVPYRVISDSYGVFVYDPDADFVRGWPASYDFRFHGWRNGVMAMKNVKDGNVYDCLTGEAVEGPAKGTFLKPLPTLESNWGPWLKAHPKTVAYEMVSKFKPSPLPKYILSESKSTRPAPDPRLDPEVRVFGLTAGKSHKAWELDGLLARGRRVVAETVGGHKVLILVDPAVRSVVAFAPETDGKSPSPASITFDPQPADPAAPWRDRETGSQWNIAGRAVAGPRKGQTLRWLPGVAVKWYAWAAEHPDTDLVKTKPEHAANSDR